ncbi:hypothetical protein EG68_06419 [Paragonimus skrjabini miyazakii]|uniref:Uncharacterized protein n=1 Tax=Paragonimus skrjabini miyazakii TaxID=59628 RepID=A0A8S9YPG1_9TREM|nr:hypothetical protein EG68_06419 [Paragonimus skrjabini miyazakii]
MDKSNMDRGDLSKIVITRNRSGRIIRCKDDDDFGDGEMRGRRDESWKRSHEDDVHEGAKRGRIEGEVEYRSTRRVFTPPRNAREGEYGSLTVHDNQNDLPMTSKSLQERVQARLRAIERRHQLEEGDGPVVVDTPGGPVAGPDKVHEGSFNANDEFPRGDSPRGAYQGHWRGASGGPMNFDRRSGGNFHRPDFYNRGGGFFPRGRGRGAPRWRGQWEDYRGRRGNWYPNRYDDRRRDGPSGGGPSGGSFDRRRRRHGSGKSSPRSSRSRSRSRSQLSKSRSRSFSHSARSSSASQSPIRPGNRGRVISRARIKTPPLAPLTNAKRSDSDENLAELDQFVAQLKAKRQMEQQFQQQQLYMAQMQEQTPAYPGPQRQPESEPAHDDETSCQEPIDQNNSRSPMEERPSSIYNSADYEAAHEHDSDRDAPEPASPEDEGVAEAGAIETTPPHEASPNAQSVAV